MDAPIVPPAAVAAPVAGVPTHLRQIEWTPGRGPRRPVVAVLDTGVDAGVPGLADAIDTRGARSFVPGTRDPLSDPSGHGTHVAGIITDVAAGNTGPGVTILPVTIADARGATRTLDLVRGVRYAVARGASVINISFGGEGFSAAEQAARDAAARAGVLVVVSAGNNGLRGGPPVYPGAYRQALAVGAVGDDGRPLLLSAKGPHLAVVAPGDGVVAARAHDRPGATEARTGTSMATAVVSGVAARILALRPRLSAPQVRTLIETTA
ncbi:MAG: S8 family serine peptidase, partial [Miltoncostaeaceae bacterium]